MDIQTFLSAMADADRETRARYHLTIGQLDALLRANPRSLVQWEDGKGADYLDSYRGYYSDCAVSDAPTPQSASGMIERIEYLRANGMQGYKGGDYPVNDRTVLWRAEFGEASGMAVIDATVNGDVITLTTRFVE